MKPPGSRALAFASRWFDPATVHRTFEPLVADWQREWIDAPRTQRWLVHAKGILAFGIAAIVSTPAIVRARAPKPLTDRIARRVAIVAAIGTIILMMPFATNDGPLRHRALVMLFVIPQALTLVFPFALISAVDAIRGFAGLDSSTARATVSKLAVLGVVFVFFCHGWVTPAANQVYREITLVASIKAQGGAESAARSARARRLPAPGVREMSNSELLTMLASAGEREPGTYRFAMSTSALREINNRAALAVLPVLLLWRRWRALDLPRGRWFSAQSAAIGTIAMTFAFFAVQIAPQIVESKWHLPVGSSYWLALGSLALLGMIRVKLAERSTVPA